MLLLRISENAQFLINRAIFDQNRPFLRLRLCKNLILRMYPYLTLGLCLTLGLYPYLTLGLGLCMSKGLCVSIYEAIYEALYEAIYESEFNIEIRLLSDYYPSININNLMRLDY